MQNLIASLLFPVMAFAAGEGGGHSHGSGGETEHLYPVLGIFAVLVIGGFIFHFMSGSDVFEVSNDVVKKSSAFLRRKETADGNIKAESNSTTTELPRLK